MVINEEETIVLSLMGKREVHAIQADPLNVLIGRVQAKDDNHDPDKEVEIDQTHGLQVVGVGSIVQVIKAIGVVQPRGGQEIDRQVEAVVHHEKAIHPIASRNSANFT